MVLIKCGMALIVPSTPLATPSIVSHVQDLNEGRLLSFPRAASEGYGGGGEERWWKTWGGGREAVGSREGMRANQVFADPDMNGGGRNPRLSLSQSKVQAVGQIRKSICPHPQSTSLRRGHGRHASSP